MPTASVRASAKLIDTAREQVAALRRAARRSEILFTSCGSEGNNAAIQSALLADRDRKHIVTSVVEHSATKNLCETLARRGYEITWLPVDADGQLDPAEAAAAIRDDTAVVSLMWANNETGVIFPVEEPIARAAREQGAYFHTDAVQAVGKIPVRLEDSAIHFLSLAGHKLHAPKGVGALYIDRRTRFTPFLVGGGQEGGRRARHGKRHGHHRARQSRRTGRRRTSKAERTVGPGAARRFRGRHPRAGGRGRRSTAATRPSGCTIRRASISRVIESEAMLVLLDKAGLCASAGSACTSGSLQPVARVDGDGFFHRTRAVQPAVFVRAVQHVGAGRARVGRGRRSRRKAAADGAGGGGVNVG